MLGMFGWGKGRGNKIRFEKGDRQRENEREGEDIRFDFTLSNE